MVSASKARSRTSDSPARVDAAPSTETGDPRYSIRVTSRLTSIELDTLRMWERRYGFPHPERSSGGSRVYSQAEIDRLKLIKRALEQGYRAGEVVGKPLDELSGMVLATASAPSSSTTGAATPTLATLLDALGRDELSVLRSELRQAAVILGPKRFIVEVAHPVCVRVGQLWADGKLEVRHEHMLTECLSAQLRVLRSTYEDHPGAPRVLLATLPDERHGLGLAMADVYLASSQVTPILLGVDTPADQIVKAARSHAADAVGLLVTQASDLKASKRHIRWMLGELPRRVGIWVGGGGGSALGIEDNAVRIVGTWSEMDEAISRLPRRTS